MPTPLLQLMPPAVSQFFDANGLPLAGGKLYSYAAGTTNPLATYTDSGGGTPNANPQILDANGKCVTWLGTAAYKFVLQDSLGNVQWTIDNVQSIPDGSITSGKIAAGAVGTSQIALESIGSEQIQDAAVDTDEIKDGAVTTAKIPDGAVTFQKLTGSTAIAFVDTSAPRSGEGPTAFPVKPWTTPVPIPAADTPPIGDGLGVAWSPNGKRLAVAMNNTAFVYLYERLGTALVKLSPGLTGGAAQVGVSIAWSPSGKFLAINGGTSVRWFQRCGNTYAEIFPPIAGSRLAGAWCPNELYYAVTSGVSPFVSVVKRGDVLKNNIVAKYTSTAGQTIASSSATSLAFATKIIDNYNSYTPIGGFFFFTALRQNGYTVKAQISFAGSVNWAAGDKFKLDVYVNSSFSESIDFHRIEATWAGAGSADNLVLHGEAWLYLSADDQVSFVITQTNASPRSLDTGAGLNMVSVVEDPSFEDLSTFTLLGSPMSGPLAGSSHALAWSPDGQFLACGHENSIYTFTVTSANASIGATYSNNGQTFTVSATIAGATILIATGPASPNASGTLTRVTGSGDATITFSAVVSSQSFLTIYQRSGDSFVKVSDPAAMPPGQVNGLAWSPDGLRLTCVHAVAPFITSYYRTATSGAGSTTFTKISANPNILPAGQGNACAYNSLNTKLAVAHNNSPFITIYSVAGSGAATTYTKDADPGTLPTGNGNSVSWTPDSQFLSVGHVSSPYVTNYQTSGAYGTSAVIYVNEVDLV